LAGDAGTLAGAEWKVGEDGGFPYPAYRIEASSPGAWANGATLIIRAERAGSTARPTVDFAIQAPGEPPEVLAGLDASRFEETGGFPSALVRLVPSGDRLPDAPPPGPRSQEWRLALAGGSLAPPDRGAYLAAAERLGDEPEVALVALPDLASDLAESSDRREVLEVLMTRADELHDRLVLVDLPCGRLEAREALDRLAELTAGLP